MILLKAQGKFIDTAPIERLFTQGEKYADRIYIAVGTVNNDIAVSDCTFVMRTVASDGSMTETVLEKQIVEQNVMLIWDVSELVTAVPGLLLLEMIGSKDSAVVIKYKMQAIYIKEAIMGANVPVPDVIDEKLAQMNDILAQAEEKLQEAENLAIGIDPTLSIAGQAADAKAAGDKITALEKSVSEISGALSEGTIQEVVDARTANGWNDRTYSSLSARLQAEFASKVSGGLFEKNMATISSQISHCTSAIETNAENIGTNANAISAAQTDIAALKASVQNLQDEDVAISKNLSATNATATAAYNKATSALEAKHTHANQNVLDTITSDTIAVLNSTATKATQNAARLDTVETIATGNQTDITALKASIANLQDEDVAIGKNIASVNATATMANNKADGLLTRTSALEETMSTALIKRDRLNGSEGADLNTAITTGMYRYTGAPTNHPITSDTTEYGILTVMGLDAYIVQTAYANCSATGFASKGGVFVRTSADSGVTWSGWMQQAMTAAAAVTTAETETEV